MITFKELIRSLKEMPDNTLVYWKLKESGRVALLSPIDITVGAPSRSGEYADNITIHFVYDWEINHLYTENDILSSKKIMESCLEMELRLINNRSHINNSVVLLANTDEEGHSIVIYTLETISFEESADSTPTCNLIGKNLDYLDWEYDDLIN